MLNLLRNMTWWQALILILCLFGCFVACLGLWLRTDYDLAAADARARTLGLPVTVADLTFAAPDPGRIADWRRLLELGAAAQPWGETTAGSQWSPTPGVDLPPALAEHHAGLADNDEVTVILARLGDDPIDTARDLSPAAEMPDATALRRLMRLRCERILLAPADRLEAEILTASALIPPREPLGLLRLMIAANLIEQWTTAVYVRRSDLGPAAAPVAARAAALEPGLHLHLAAAYRNDLASMRGFIASADPGRLWAGLGRSGGLWSWDAWGFALAVRSGREPTLSMMQDIAAVLAASTNARAQLEVAQRIERSASTTAFWRPGSLLPARILPVSSLVIAGAHTARLRLLVLAAELTGTPWPADALDPAGGPVRRAERDGVLVGAYSVGADGRDDGGDLRTDRAWPIHAPLGSPRAGDALPAAEPVLP